MNEFNKRTALNYQLRQDAEATRKKHCLAKRRIAGRRFVAALRQRNKLIALDMALAGVLGVALGVLACFIF